MEKILTKQKHEYDLTSLGIILFAALLILSILTGVLLARAESQRYTQQEIENVQHALDNIRTALQGRIYSNIYKVSAVTALVAMNPELTQDDFAKAMEVQFKGEHDLRNVGLARDMIIQFMYPIEGNEAAIGLDYRTLPNQFEAVSLALKLNEIVLAGPLKLVQGGEGIIARIPISSADATAQQKGFWGVASVVMNAETIFAGAGIKKDHDVLQIALRGRDASGPDGEVFWGDPLIFEQQPVTQLVELPHGSWQIAAIPASGWNSYIVPLSALMWLYFAVVLVILAFNALIISLLAKHKKTVNTLRKERNIFAKGPVFSMEWAPEHQGHWSIKSASSNVEKILGYTPTEMLQPDFSYDTLIHADDLERVLDRLKHNIAHHIDRFEDTYRLQTRAGHYLWVYDFTVLVRDGDGHLTDIRSYLYDQSEQKRTEEALRIAEARLEKTAYELTENIPVGTYTMVQPSEGGMANFAFMSSRFLKLLGLTREEVDANPHAPFARVHPDDIDAFMALNIRAFKEKITFYAQARILADNGEIRWITAESRPRTLPNNTTVWEGVVTDISDRKRAEAALSESLQRFNDLVAHISMGIYVFWHRANQEMEFEYVSDSWCAMNQLRREDVLTNPLAAFEVVHPDERKHFRLLNQRAMHKRMRFSWEGRVIVGGDEIFMLIESTPVFFDNGDSRWFGVQQDVTERRRLEEQIIKEKERAEAANLAKSQFLANMSHEIRTPLNGVIGFTDLLQKTELSSLQRQYADNANVSGHALLEIINDILDFSKIEAGMMELEMVKTDMLELFEGSVDIVKFTAGKKYLEILLDIDADMPRFAIVDPIRLRQIITNLLSNAVKFTHKGEIELKVSYAPGIERRGTFFISIRDTGIGITEQQQERLFQAFSQADNSTTRKFGGTGLGLVISQMLAQKMGSHIQLESVQGKGTTFSFHVTAETHSREDTSNPSNLAHVKTCLIIDDNAHSRQILAQQLAHWNIRCESCESGFAALEILQTFKAFDVIICDYNMPALDGLETIRMIYATQQQTSTQPPVILLHTSSDDAKLHAQCETLGIQFCISKPIKQTQLFSCLTMLHAPPAEQAAQPAPPLETAVATHTAHNATNTDFTILIAEDVAMNMLLLKSLLSRMVPHATIVEAQNGSIAVQKYQETQPDLIFMDVHMPEMDGLAAIRAIREQERSSYKHVPTVALTAGALKEEMEQCFEAGMDVFLTKPIESEKLQKLLAKYSTKLSENNSPSSMRHVDRERLLSYGEIEFVKQVVTVLKIDIPKQIESINVSIRCHDTESLRRQLHTLKGAALNGCLPGVAATAEAMEQLVKNDASAALLEEKQMKLRHNWNEAKRELKTLLK